MNGAESLIRAALQQGVDTCFANPGTTEMQLVAALDAVPGMRAVLGLFEGVCTGAADGYGRMLGRPALTLLHLGPGFANGIANLHNARRAHSPVVNLIGDQASWHLAADAPLTSDIDSLARPVSGWVRTSTSADGLAQDAADAVAAARSAPGQVASLILPADFQELDAGDGHYSPQEPNAPAAVSSRHIESIARRLLAGETATILVGGAGLDERGQRAADRIARHTGGTAAAECFPARWERGGGLPALARLPYFPEQAIEFLQAHDFVIVAGAPEPVSFFGYEGTPSRLVTDDRLAILASPGEDVIAALEGLAEAVDAKPVAASPAALPPAPQPGPLSVGNAGSALAAALPEGAIIVDEAATSGLAFYAFSQGAPRHSLLALTGGAIGQGLPCATGAAIACPDRKVIAFQADGSGAYTLQSLWTMAREQLDVVVLICSNRAYRILQVELGRAGIAEPGRQAMALTNLTQPEIDWTALAKGFGVPAERVDSAEALEIALARALASEGPRLIEMVLS